MTNTNNLNWMIYGANGYTGELIAREAVRQGLKPILAGLNQTKVAELAQELGLEFRAFGLDEVTQCFITKLDNILILIIFII